jgi:cation/acetate symporter
LERLAARASWKPIAFAESAGHLRGRRDAERTWQMAGLRPPEADIGVSRAPSRAAVALLCSFALLLLVLVLVDRIGLASGALGEAVIVGGLAVFVLAAFVAPGHRPADHYVAGRAVGTLSGGFAAAAGLVGMLVIGLLGGIFSSGSEVVGAACGMLAGLLVLTLFIATRLRRVGGLSVGDFLAVRFGAWARVAGAAVGCVSSFLLLLAALKTSGALLAALIGFAPVQGVYAAAMITVLVVLPGGLRSLTWAQVAQYWLTGLACVLAFGFLGWHGGTLSAVIAATAANVQSLMPSFLAPTDVGIALDAALPLLLLAAGTAALPPMLARPLAASSGRCAGRTVAWSFVFAAALVAAGLVLGATLVGVSGLPAASGASNDLIGLALPILAGLPPILLGLIMAGGLAALFAVGEAALFATAAAVSHDIWDEVVDRRGPTGRRMLVARALVVAAAAAAAWVLGGLPVDAPALLGWAFGFAAAGNFVPLVLGLWWRRCNEIGALAGTLVGFGVVGFGFVLDLGLVPGLPAGRVAGIGSVGAAALGLSGSLLAAVAASLMTRAPPAAAQTLMDKLGAAREMPPMRERPA